MGEKNEEVFKTLVVYLDGVFLKQGYFVRGLRYANILEIR
jgi:hypothetical protein